MSIFKLLKYISTHPLSKNSKGSAFKKLLKWQISQKLINRPMLMPFIGESSLLVEKGMTGATGNIYTGLHEFEEMAFLLHCLRKEDVFFDVGANVGSYSVLASKVVGAKTVCFEPSPFTYERLLNNLFLNRIQENTLALNMGVGSQKDVLYFTRGKDTTNHILMEERDNSQRVEVESLDHISEQENLVPQLIKIDVEGFETKVIEGAEQILEKSELKAVIMELNGSGNRYGFNEDAIHQQMIERGFKAYHYQPFERKLELRVNRSFHGNTIYLKDVVWAKERLTSSIKFEALGQYF